MIPITNPLKDKECGASPTAVGYQMRAPGTNRSPALARLEFHLFIGIAQSDPHAAADNIKGVLDAGVIVPGHPLRGCLSSPPSPAARPSWPVTARGGRATTETLRRVSLPSPRCLITGRRGLTRKSGTANLRRQPGLKPAPTRKPGRKDQFRPEDQLSSTARGSGLISEYTQAA